MEYSKYEKSRDLSWKILLNQKITCLPVKVSSICHSMGCRITDYERSREFIDKFSLQSRIKNSDGFTCSNIIFYNKDCTVQRQRFTVAHELGHILLHSGRGIYNREPNKKDNPIEQEANVFASRLLAPSCVLWGMGVTTEQQIANICDISMQSAEFRMERLNELYKREKDFIRKYGRSCFLLSPLEQAVYKQFKDYIDMHKFQ